VSALVRRATADDAAALREIRLLALSDEPDAFGSTYVESSRYPASRWAEMAAHWNYYLAIVDEEVVGMASGGRFDPRPSARWLYGMFVRPVHRGTGVSEALVHAVADWTRAERVATLGLHVTTSVSRACAFYAKLGFVPDGTPEPMDRDPRLMLQTMLTDVTTNDRI
jgi:GNAT superfamily N-acetyltransferase